MIAPEMAPSLHAAPSFTSAARRASDGALPDLARRFTRALVSGDSRDAEAVVNGALARGISPTDVHVGVIQAAMEEIGALWECAELTVADEHVATAISHRVLVRLYEALCSDAETTRERIVVAAVQGQQHTLGLRVIADVLEGAGFDVTYLGGDVPVAALAEFVAGQQPAVVGLGFRLGLGQDNFEEAITALRAASPATRIIVGGGPPPEAMEGRPVAWVSSAKEVVPVVERLLAANAAPPAAAGGRARTSRVAATPDGRPDSAGSLLAAEAEAATDDARRYARDAQHFRRLAFRDPLTGLPNRRAFDERAGAVAASPRAASLVVIDVDHFKDVNDTGGHEAGDRLLREIAARAASAVRPEDMIARVGGDEFGMVLADCDANHAVAVAERVRASVSALGTRVTLSLGVAVLRDDVRAAMLEADRALYDAKAAGRDRVCAPS